MKHPSQVFLKTIIPSSGMVQTENGLQIDCLEIQKGQNGSDKNTVSFHPAISFPPLYPRALRKGVWKIKKSGIWNPESRTGTGKINE